MGERAGVRHRLNFGIGIIKLCKTTSVYICVRKLRVELGKGGKQKVLTRPSMIYMLAMPGRENISHDKRNRPDMPEANAPDMLCYAVHGCFRRKSKDDEHHNTSATV